MIPSRSAAAWQRHPARRPVLRSAGRHCGASHPDLLYFVQGLRDAG